MHRFIALALILLVFGTTSARTTFAQEAESESSRKVVSRVLPVYPEMASKMHLTGSVKLLVTVAPDGTVRSVETRGGHPVLAKAAETAIYKWKWIPAREETREPVEMKFNPN